MMIKRILTMTAACALCAAGTSIASAQGYSVSPPGSTYAATQAGYPADYHRPGQMDEMPNFDDVDDGQGNGAQNSTALSPPGPVMSPNDPRYGRPAGQPTYSDRGAAPQGPVMSPDDPRYGRPAGQPTYSDRGAAPQGPVMSPDDPRYGRPYTPAAANYGGNGDGMRPPAGVTGSVSPMPMGSDGKPTSLSALPADEQPEADQGGEAQLAPNLRRQEVNFVTKEPAGTIVVDTPHTYLYYILGNNRAIRYGVRVGRDGFTWTGVQKISRKAEWPDWHPPTEMIERQPYLPRFMAGGPGNPLGARAMYLGSTVYRIHGTNQPSTIGKFVSSGCIGMLNEDVENLFDRVKVGTRVVVLPGGGPHTTDPVASAQPAAPAQGGYSDNTVAQASGTTPTVVPPLPAPVSVR
jgi:lipoprotein-anchoring transpeptidase ErfK/SrfK